MPPPSRVPSTRPASSLADSDSGARAATDASRPSSPRKSRKTGAVGVPGKKDGTDAGETNIQVVVRCRGRSSQEIAQASPAITTTGGPLSKAITIETTPTTSGVSAFTTASSYGGSHGPSTKTYPFDKVFGPEADQTMVFREVVESMLDEVLAGYNCTIFAYGQTGTGKTYTMQGDVGLTPLQAPSTEAGIIPRVLHRLFHLLESSPNSEYSVKCSYIELYNEELRDLLAPEYKDSSTQPMGLSAGGRDTGGLKIYEDGSKKGVMIQGLEETGVRSLQEGLALLGKGSQRRQVAETKMNTESSRSHSIFTLTVHVKETSATGSEDMLRIGKFNLVDLAGSEAIGRSGAQDKRAREAGMINQSLLTLGRVISALVEKGSHIPYRESKLTRLLQDSLGGRTKTCIVATVSPTRSNMEETISTLDYAIRAKSIRNKPEVNAHLTKAGLLKEYIGDIERLKAELQATRDKNGVYIPEDQWREMQDVHVRQRSDHDEARQKAAAIAVELATRKQEFDDLTKRFMDTTTDLAAAREAERQLGLALDAFKLELEAAKVKLEEETAVRMAYQEGEESLAQVAGGLRAIANNSVRDIDGLFGKIARKAKVLGANADAATQFGGDLHAISGELREALAVLGHEQAGFGQVLRSNMEAYAQRQAEDSQAELARLDASLKTFNDLTKSLAKSVDKGKVEAVSASAAIIAVKDEVQQAVRAWASAFGERSDHMVGELLSHQSKHLVMVGHVLGATADMAESVIAVAEAHVAEEAAASAAAIGLVQTAASEEIRRLKAQNDLLTRTLAQEQSKSHRLRTELLGNITSMVMSFTDAQDASLEAAVTEVRNANDAGVEGMTTFVGMFEAGCDTMAQQRDAFTATLLAQQQSTRKQRLSGDEALDEVKQGMHTEFRALATDMATDARQHGQVVDNFCAKLAGATENARTSAEKRASKQLAGMSALVRAEAESHTTASAKINAGAADVASLTSTLLNSHEDASASFSSLHGQAESHVDRLVGRTASFLTEGVREDASTGETPRKKAWDIPQTWDRVQPRQVIIDNMRRAALEEQDPVPSVASTTSLTSLASSMVSEPPVDTVPPPASKDAGLGASQLRAPRARLGRKLGGAVEVEEKMLMAVLGEGGNVPRRIRR